MKGDVVLLTGLPSFLARELCEQILRAEPQTRLHAVVPSSAAAEVEAFLEGLPEDQRRRVNIVEGDPAAMDLGLSGSEFRALGAEVERIHHAAEATYRGVDRRTAETVNVGGVREILELASACRKLRCLVHHSTARVAGDRTGVVREDDLQRGQKFPSVVEETKARGEKLVRAAMGRVPAAVVRPSIIVGDSRTGEVDRFDGPYLLIVLILTSPPDLALPLPGRGDVALHLVPVDYVVRAAHAIGRSPKAPGRTFHLVDPAPLTARRVFELVARAGGRPDPRGTIPANLTKALLRTPGLERLAQRPRAFLEAMVTDVTYSAANTQEVLGDVSSGGDPITCPPLEGYVDKLVEFVERRLKEKRAKKSTVEIDDPLV